MGERLQKYVVTQLTNIGLEINNMKKHNCVKTTNSIQDRIGEKWSKYYEQTHRARTHWWQSPCIIRHINEIVTGTPMDGFSAGITMRAKEMAGSLCPFSRGISVGCGNARKEITLIREGLVNHFQLYELSKVCIEQGKELAAEYGVEDSVDFVLGDAFEIVNGKECFNFVHWNNSLHHMLNVEMALKWSYDVLEKGGMFYMDDFVGPSRFQWSDRMLKIASAVRTALPEKYLLKPWPKGWKCVKQLIKRLFYPQRAKSLFPRVLQRPSIDDMISSDPSEAADSERIVHCVKKFFPNAEITLTGGVIYSLALSKILQNFDESKDQYILNLLMTIDDSYTKQYDTFYATALAIK